MRYQASIRFGAAFSLTLMLVTMIAPFRAYAIGAGVQPVITIPGSVNSNPVADPAIVTLSATQQARKGALGTGLGLDAIAWQVGKIAIQSMTKSMVNWINSGFNGSPAFVTDLEGHLLKVSDAVAGSFLNQLLTNPALKSPFQSTVAKDVAALYYLSTSRNGFFTQSAYSLNRVTPNDAAFLAGNFNKGGIPAWFSAVSHPQNNPYGARMLAEAVLGAKTGNARQVALTQLGWGQGFLSWCGSDSGSDSSSGATDTGSGAIESVVVTPEVCIGSDGKPGRIQTPGSVIQGQINHTLGLSGDTLVTADEFNEIIGALMSQLVNQVVGGVGLSGVSSVSSGGKGYIDRAADPSQTTQNPKASALEQSIVAEMDKLTGYQADWQALQSAAQSAQAKAPGCAFAGNVLTASNAALVKANAALATLQTIENRIASATASNSPAAIQKIDDDFGAFLADPATPSATDITYARTQADGSDGTLYTKLTQTASDGICPTS